MMQVETIATPRQRLPVGFRFQPTDKEVFDHYLKWRNTGLPFSNDVPDIKNTMLDPWELPQQFQGPDEINYQGNDNDWWFFSPRVRNQKTTRLTGSGKWESTCLDKGIMDEDKNQMGIMTSFVFHLRQDRGKYKRFATWKLYEYRLTNECLDGLLLLDENIFALCHLKRDNKAKSKTDVQDRQTNGEISSGVQPRQSKRMAIEVSYGTSSGSGSSGSVDFSGDIPSNSLEDQTALWSDEEQWQPAMLLGSFIPAELPLVPPHESLLHQPNQQKNTHILLSKRQTESAKSVSGFVPAEEKKSCAENRIARPEPSPSLSPDTVERPKHFKASNSPTSAESFPKDEARVVKKEPPAANPHWKEIFVAKIEEDEELARETTEKLRLKTEPMLITQNQNFLSSRFNYSLNVAVGLVLAIFICSQMLCAGIFLLVWMLLIRLLMKSL